MLRFIAVLLTLAFISPASAQGVGLSGGKGSGTFLTNPSDPVGAGPYQFINFVKLCQDRANSPVTAWPGTLNALGYPTSSPSVDIICNFSPPINYTGRWVVKWTGSFGSGGNYGVALAGDVSAAWTINADTGSCATTSGISNGIRLTGTNCTVEFTPSAGTKSIQLQFLGSGTGANISNITDIAVYRKDHATEYAAGEIFNPDYLTMMRQLNPKILRMLGFNKANGDNRTRFSQLTPNNYMTYSSSINIDTAWAGTASYDSGSNTYTVSQPADWAGLVDGAAVQFYIPTGAANTDSGPLLKVTAGGTAKTMKSVYNSAIGVGEMGQNQLRTFVYVKLFDTWEYNPQITSSSGGFNPQVPLAVQIALCNKLEKDCWFNIPYLFDQPSMLAFGNYVRDNLNQSLRAYFEYSNEIGTPSPAFAQTYWAGEVSVPFGLPFTSFGQYTMGGLGTARMMTQIASTWTANGRSASTLKGVITGLVFQNYNYLRDQKFNGDWLGVDADGYFTTGNAGATATGTISGSTLTVTGFTGSIRVGMPITGAGVTANTYIISRGTGAGGNGTYTLNNDFMTSSGPFTLTAGGTGAALAEDYTASPNRPRDKVTNSSVAMYYRGPNFNYYDCQQGSSTTYFCSMEYGDYPGSYNALKTITAISKANPGVVTSAGHGYSNGDRVLLGSTLLDGSNGPITGMTELDGALTTVANADTDTFQLSNTVNADGTTRSSNTSSYGTFTAGKMARLQPGVNTDILNAADDYASGVPSRMRSALNYMSNDAAAGTRLNGSGVAQAGGATIEWFQTNASAGWPAWRDYFSGPSAMNLPMIPYEGGYDSALKSVLQMNRLGISTDYANKLNALLLAWRTSDHARENINYMLQAFKSISGNLYPGNLTDAGGGAYTTLTASIAGSVLTVTATSGEIKSSWTVQHQSVADGVYITKQLTGSTGSTGTYQLNTAPGDVGSSTMYLLGSSDWSLFTGNLYSAKYNLFYGWSNFGAAP